LATLEVLNAQLVRYEDLPRTVPELHAVLVDPSAVDFDEKFVRGTDGRLYFNFGKYAKQALSDIANDPRRRDYLNWMLSQDFLPETKAIVRTALGGQTGRGLASLAKLLGVTEPPSSPSE
jgi:DNA polymerase-3 subunit epsilon